MATGTDYDTPRVIHDADAATNSGLVGQLTVRRNNSASSIIDSHENEPSELPDGAYADPGFVSELSTPVVAQQHNEFICSRCFLILHRRRYARTLRSKPICHDCS